MIALLPAFFLIAFLYSTMGFGGGSSYLAALSLAGFSHTEIPPLALACNLIVSGLGFLQFRRAGHFEAKKLFPFLLLSVPMAYCGARMIVGRELFFLLLGTALLVMGFRMLMPSPISSPENPSPLKRWSFGLPAGGVIGFFSGMLGIGGGIFLSPLLLVMRWAGPKQSAAAASLFIFVNSLAALAGHLEKAPFNFGQILPLAGVVLFGGCAGSYLGAYQIPKIALQRLLGGFVLYSSIKMLVRLL